MIHSKNIIAIPPGATVREQLENRSMSQKEFAQRMGMSEKHISHLINGKVELTHEVALRLESVLGIPAKFWNNMEALYREQEARVLEELALEHDESIAMKMPYTKCAELGWLEKTRNRSEKVYNLRRFFEVANLGILDNLQLPGIAYRVAGSNVSKDYAQAMWAQKARIEARSVKTSAINIEYLIEIIPQIRALTTKDPSEFCEVLGLLLPKCGIALVFLPHIDGSFIHGATFVDGNHIVLGLTVRGKYADKFWFSLFHELGHIIHGHIMNPLDEADVRETEADTYAMNTLIPVDKYEAFIARRGFNKSDIEYFSKIIDIAPGIVLGRLQKENYVPYNQLHELKIQSAFEE